MDGIFLATTLPSFHDIVSLATIQRSICIVPVSTLSSVTWPTMGSFTLLHFLTPMNAVIKNSDKNRSRTVAGIHIIDQLTLRAASAYFVDRGLP